MPVLLWLRQPISDRQECLSYFVGALATGDVAGEGATVGCTDGVGVASGEDDGASDCSTDRVPVTAGNDSINAINMNDTAAPIVIFAKSVCVPRGPNAVLDTLLAKRSPAPDLPGCKRITTISITHDSMNNPYKT